MSAIRDACWLSHKRRLFAKSEPVSASPSTKPIFEKRGYLIKAIYTRPSSASRSGVSFSCRWKNRQYPRRWHSANSRDKLLIIISILGGSRQPAVSTLRSIHASPQRGKVLLYGIQIHVRKRLTILIVYCIKIFVEKFGYITNIHIKEKRKIKYKISKIKRSKNVDGKVLVKSS